MIDSNNPEINVDELMQKIRQEVAKRQVNSQRTETKNNNIDISILKSNISYIESLLINAESRSYARSKWPDKLNRFPFNISSKLQKNILKAINFVFKDQREVNFNLLLAVKESVKLNRQLIEQIQTLTTQTSEQFTEVKNSLQEINEIPNAAPDNSCQEINEFLGNLDNNVQGINERLSIVDMHFLEMHERLSSLDTRFQGMHERLSVVDNNIQRHNERLDHIDSRFQGMEKRLGGVDSSIQRIDERYHKNDSYLKNDLIQQKRLISLFLEEAQRRLPEPFNQEQLQSFVDENQHSLDAFYVAFEDQFRGSREEIKNRLLSYISVVEKAVSATDNSPTLDIGCGRGEWIEMLSEQGFQTSGIDINNAMVHQCQSLGLNAVLGDGLQFLRSLPNNSLAVVSSFHVIEHLQMQQFMALLDEVLRVLRPGGTIILETPNPENLIVGACNFYLDPTHRNPIPPPTAQFILENRGFTPVEIRRIHPMNENHHLDNAFLNSLLLGCQDYAVIGWKA
ncbi:class I SAM-dependent methyltransferase [Anabaena sp. CCY 0017]|uniref:class I SAM-dependent methyltransferase n=1 Tax=Anabaena sp. CCY 0017 TaxID=3103866 RepID=UPI0039C746FA